MNRLYNLAYTAGQTLRRKNYRLFRRIVENSLVNRAIKSLSAEKIIEVSSPEGAKLFINPIYHGNFLSSDSIRAYEPHMRKLLGEIVKPGMVVYDVGANVGVISLLLLDKIGAAGHLYAFEPEPNNLRCLKATCQHNTYDNFEILEAGVGKTTETLFFDRKGGAMSGRLVDDPGSNNNNIVAMSVIGLDDFIFDQNKKPPNLLKIDVEGNETLVIEGMRRALEAHKPTIICELHHRINPSVVDIYQELAARGYSSYDVIDWVAGKKQALSNFEGVHHFIAFADPL